MRSLKRKRRDINPGLSIIQYIWRMAQPYTTSDVAAVVCTLNSISSIRQCLKSLRNEGVGEIVVVDASSTDGTREVAEELADVVVTDPGIGLGNARNLGILSTSASLILNMGSDNVMPTGQLQRMIDALTQGRYQGVSAQTWVEGDSYLARGLNAWRTGRFQPGSATVIGTPTLFDGELLRSNLYETSRRFSDDSELCERWAREFGATFAISEAFVEEIGKTTWDEVRVRCRMYGVSDYEVFREGRRTGWTRTRQLKSIIHPLRVDLIQPMSRLGPRRAVECAPFLFSFAAMRYAAWLQAATRPVRKRRINT